jgi:hypothetical protein
MTSNLVIRTAVISEHQELEALQRRASLNNPGDREALLANPDSIELPREQIDLGHVFVADADGIVVGMAAVICREDRDTDLACGSLLSSVWFRRGWNGVYTVRCRPRIQEGFGLGETAAPMGIVMFRS